MPERVSGSVSEETSICSQDTARYRSFAPIIPPQSYHAGQNKKIIAVFPEQLYLQAAHRSCRHHSQGNEKSVVGNQPVPDVKTQVPVFSPSTVYMPWKSR